MTALSKCGIIIPHTKNGFTAMLARIENSERLATPEDIPQIISGLREFWRMSFYPDFVPFDGNTLKVTLASLIERKDGVLFTNGHGAIAGLAVPFFFNNAVIQAIELFWYADKGGQNLKRAFEQWGRDQGASVVVMGSVPHKRRSTVDQVYKRQGFVEGEHLFLKELN